MAAFKLLNKKCGRIRAVNALNLASEMEGARLLRRDASMYMKQKQKKVSKKKC